ncbi:hypothetical protein [Ferroacidibacillus organovorans]|uniref:hypothetical protein n=1 Tax=Ferroacidibacillus organovorans TaxID=1765683 RepID=UPI00082C7FED|nr:hypothetical protein [Ferroacidibacillus organovorans]
MPEESRLTPWRLFEVPFPLQFPEPERREVQRDDHLDIKMVRDPWRVNPAFRPSVIQANFLYQMNDPHDANIDNLLNVLYTHPDDAAAMAGNSMSSADKAYLKSLGGSRNFVHSYITHIGYPISFDPIREVLLTGYPLTVKPKSSQEVVKAFLNLNLTYGNTASNSDRATILTFVADYGFFIPFVPLSGMNGDRIYAPHISIMQVREYHDSLWMAFPPAFDPISSKATSNFDLLLHSLSGQIAKPTPYRDPNTLTRSRFQTRWLYYFEAFRVWHEAATTLQSMRPNEIDYTDKPPGTLTMTQWLFKTLVKSCMHAAMNAEPLARNEAGLSHFRIYDNTLSVEGSYPCSVVLMDLHGRLHRMFEEETEGLKVKVSCMASGCNGTLTKGHDKYRIAKECGEEWRYCSVHENRKGKSAFRAICKQHPEHEKAAAWLNEIREMERMRRKRKKRSSAIQQP